MERILFNDKELRDFTKRMNDWAANGVNEDVQKSADKIATDYRTKIKSGKTGDNSQMANVKQVTMESPIRHGSDPAIRGEVRSSRTPLYARGRAVNSIKAKRTSKGADIGPTTVHGQTVFGYNAFSAKTKRDPLIVSDAQLDIIEKEILKSLDKVIKG